MSVEDLLSDIKKVVPEYYFNDVKIRIEAFIEKNMSSASPKTFELIDEVTGSTLKVEATVGAYGLNIQPRGYSDAQGGAPILLDFFSKDENDEDNLRVQIWGDINSEDPTHTISMKGAKSTDIENNLFEHNTTPEESLNKSPKITN